jgi:ribonuclease BN (tRNA processing enzyme)
MVGRAASSNAIVLDGKARILVDAGSGAAVRLGEAGLDIEDLDTILLTHLHIDHSGDLPGVAKARGMIHQGPMTFRVFGPAGRGVFPSTTRFVARLFDPDGIYAYQRSFGAEEHFAVMDLPIDLAAPAREILREGDLRIRSVATNHGEAPSVAYRIDGPGWSIAFSGDLDPSGLPNLTRLATGVDLLVFNCAVLDPPGSPRELYTRHTAPRQIGEVARAAGARRLVLTHIPPLVDKASREVLASVGAAYAGPVDLAADRMRVPLRAP